MADETPKPEPAVTPPDTPATSGTVEPSPAETGDAGPTPKKSGTRTRRAPAAPKGAEKRGTAPKAPNRPTLEPELARLLVKRRAQDRRRPKFVRQQAHRYFAIGRWETWRRPRGQQSKQRRHYGYRPTVVSIGFGSPRRTRGLTPTGFEPKIVRTPRDVEGLDAKTQAALIARTVGTRKRLVLEEVARKRGIHVLNPLVRERTEG